jgi:hypothetical protein
LRLHTGLNVIILRGGTEDESEQGVDDVVVQVDDGSTSCTTLAFELEGGEDSEEADGRRDEEFIELDKKEAEGLRGGEEMGDKRKI